MSWQIALKKLVGSAPSSFSGDEPPWAVIGSVASALQGCFISPRDIDLLAREPDEVYRFAELMSIHTPPRCDYPPGHEKWLSSEETPLSVGPDDYGFVWHFARWKVTGVKVEMAHILAPEGFPTSEDGGGIWEAGPEIWPHLRKASFAGYAVPVVPLEIQLETSLSRGLGERATEIASVLRRDGCDCELVRKALRSEHLKDLEALVG